MGPCISKSAAQSEDAQVPDQKRFDQRKKRDDWQKTRQPTKSDQQKRYIKSFETISSKWPVPYPWNQKGRHTQGVILRVVEPKNLRDDYFTLVARNTVKYVVRVGFGSENIFDTTRLVMTFNLPQVSNKHAKFHFVRMRDRSSIFLEDEVSLNGTFLLKHAYEGGPIMEKEVKEMSNLADVEYVRFGQGLLVSLEATNIFWDTEEDDTPLTERAKLSPDETIAQMMGEGWYFPVAFKKWS
eukprot:c8550_g1_i1.p1 GENE.c8550_g1_i1~~c8550_g1_i1.p1  ORF type:complete len:240 (+),score=39.02 c8550_g1_i1:147-866(+)